MLVVHFLTYVHTFINLVPKELSIVLFLIWLVSKWMESERMHVCTALSSVYVSTCGLLRLLSLVFHCLLEKLILIEICDEDLVRDLQANILD
jgi:hypothetical protein